MVNDTARPTENQVLAAKLYVKVSNQLGEELDPRLVAIAEWPEDDIQPDSRA